MATLKLVNGDTYQLNDVLNNGSSIELIITSDKTAEELIAEFSVNGNLKTIEGYYDDALVYTFTGYTIFSEISIQADGVKKITLLKEESNIEKRVSSNEADTISLQKSMKTARADLDSIIPVVDYLSVMQDAEDEETEDELNNETNSSDESTSTVDASSSEE